jgi:archaellum component FlaC
MNDEIERLNQKIAYLEEQVDRFSDDTLRLMTERNLARLRLGRILNEIDCRVQHGAESNGHLEEILEMFKEDNK